MLIPTGLSEPTACQSYLIPPQNIIPFLHPKQTALWYAFPVLLTKFLRELACGDTPITLRSTFRFSNKPHNHSNHQPQASFYLIFWKPVRKWELFRGWSRSLVLPAETLVHYHIHSRLVQLSQPSSTSPCAPSYHIILVSSRSLLPCCLPFCMGDSGYNNNPNQFLLQLYKVTIIVKRSVCWNMYIPQ